MALWNPRRDGFNRRKRFGISRSVFRSSSGSRSSRSRVRVIALLLLVVVAAAVGE